MTSLGALWVKAGHEVMFSSLKLAVVVEIEGGKHDFVPGLDPQGAERAADASRTDHAYPELRRGGALREQLLSARDGEAGDGGAGRAKEPATGLSYRARIIHAGLRSLRMPPPARANAYAGGVRRNVLTN